MPNPIFNDSILVTGGAGFIGGHFVRRIFNEFTRSQRGRIINLDKQTYAGSLDGLPVADGERYVFSRGDIGDVALVSRLLQEHRPGRIVNFAAETHVDRSIQDPSVFFETNVLATSRFLDCVTRYFAGLDSAEQDAFRFLQVSTDEVYGSLGPTGAFQETDAYRPNSPYAASKAASDLTVRAYRQTYGLPTLVSHSSNNYGPYQFPEKLIPLMICKAIEGKPLPIYGDGLNVRDWLHVEDHCAALSTILSTGEVGQSYNVGGSCERTNLEIVRTLCRTVDVLMPNLAHRPTESLITFVDDRPGHDRRYAINSKKIRTELGWAPQHAFEPGIVETVRWYVDHLDWCRRVCRDGR